jgi:hypothetical protein
LAASNRSLGKSILHRVENVPQSSSCFLFPGTSQSAEERRSRGSIGRRWEPKCRSRETRRAAERLGTRHQAQMTATQNRPFHLTDCTKCHFLQWTTRADGNLRLNHVEGPFCGGHLWMSGVTKTTGESLLGALYGWFPLSADLSKISPTRYSEKDRARETKLNHISYHMTNRSTGVVHCHCRDDIWHWRTEWIGQGIYGCSFASSVNAELVSLDMNWSLSDDAMRKGEQTSHFNDRRWYPNYYENVLGCIFRGFARSRLTALKLVDLPESVFFAASSASASHIGLPKRCYDVDVNTSSSIRVFQFKMSRQRQQWHSVFCPHFNPEGSDITSIILSISFWGNAATGRSRYKFNWINRITGNRVSRCRIPAKNVISVVPRNDYHQEWLRLARWSLLGWQLSDPPIDPSCESAEVWLGSSRLHVLDCSITDQLRLCVQLFYVPVLGDSEIIAANPPQCDGAFPFHRLLSLVVTGRRKGNMLSPEWLPGSGGPFTREFGSISIKGRSSVSKFSATYKVFNSDRSILGHENG